MKLLKNIFTIFSFVVVIDFLFFKVLIWKLPNESPWGTNHFFNFEYERKRISSKKKVAPRILIVGSSIAYYSMDRELLKTYLHEKTGKDFDIEYFSYAGMTPLDAYLCFDSIRELNPEIILFPVNFIDYRIHRAYAINPSSLNASGEKELIRDALNFSEAPQSRYSFPFPTLKNFWNVLELEKNFEYLSSSLFGFYRYREIYFQNLKNLYNHRMGRNTSYHGYAGVQIPERVSSLGWTGKSFTFFPTKKMKHEGFFIQLVPEIFRNGKLILEITNAKKESQILEFTKSGWIQIYLDEKFFLSKEQVTVTLSDTWRPKNAKEDRFDHSNDDVGVRLQQTFGLEEPLRDMQYVREERSEDLRYVGMSDAQYQKYFEYRLLDDFANRPGIAYLHALKNAKLKVVDEKFLPTLQMKYLKLFAEKAQHYNQKVIVVNNPENPISMEWYSKSTWYKAHLDFLISISGGSIHFVDFKNFLPMQDFSDFHHFTYPGMVKMNSTYGDAILKQIGNK
ncbi:MAG: hypothetical protein L6Q54_06500 [Leptospiraceae bacterium]|nr:hypothetical protein [Leptospiraceae bacterium]MCK6380886.1 hypothetical protein [Leptospiraceae bacterium]NUM41471.1 hypothetical protein [Leptospiraceae bacterium]